MGRRRRKYMRHLLGIRHIRQIATFKGNLIRSGAGIFVVVLYRWASGGTGGNTPSVNTPAKFVSGIHGRYVTVWDGWVKPRTVSVSACSTDAQARPPRDDVDCVF